MEGKDKIVFSDEDEDEKVEKFFELVRNLKNLRESNGKRKRAATTSGPGGWAPAFQWEDFTTEIEFKKHAPMFQMDPPKEDGKT